MPSISLGISSFDICGLMPFVLFKIQKTIGKLKPPKWLHLCKIVLDDRGRFRSGLHCLRLALSDYTSMCFEIPQADLFVLAIMITQFQMRNLHVLDITRIDRASEFADYNFLVRPTLLPPSGDRPAPHPSWPSSNWLLWWLVQTQQVSNPWIPFFPHEGLPLCHLPAQHPSW